MLGAIVLILAIGLLIPSSVCFLSDRTDVCSRQLTNHLPRSLNTGLFLTDGFSASKRELLKAVSTTRKRRSIDAPGEGSVNDRNDVIRLVTELEKSFETSNEAVLSADSLNGAWSLVYSTRASATTTSSLSFFDVISGNLYKLFFKFAPFLAGSQGPDLGNKLGVTNEQIIDVGKGSILNTVSFKAPKSPFNSGQGGGKGVKDNAEYISIIVQGNLGKPQQAPKVSKAIDITVEFTEFSLEYGVRRLQLPLPRPKGSLKTTFCDGDLRISRGGQGGLFIVKKINSENAPVSEQ